MLQAQIDGKSTEDNQKNEKIIGAQRLFEQIAGEEFKRLLVAEVTQDTDAEQHCEANPRETPERRLAQSQFSWPTVKDAEVQRDGDQDEKIEFDPAQRRAHGRNGAARHGAEPWASTAVTMASSRPVPWPGR